MRYSCKFLIFLLVAQLFFACNGKNENDAAKEKVYVDPRTDESMLRSRRDTLAILYNVNEYLRKLKENKIDSALEMLFVASGDTVIPAPDKKKQEVREIVKVFPVLDYKIDHLSLFSEQDTEVRYTIKYFEKEDNDPRPNTLQCVINPRRVGYYWFLTIAPATYETIPLPNN